MREKKGTEMNTSTLNPWTCRRCDGANPGTPSCTHCHQPEANPIQTQLDEIKATLEAIRQGIEALEARLTEDNESCSCESCVKNREDFNAWADAFSHRWEGRKQGVGCCVPDNATYKPCGPLCLTHGDVRDTSIKS